MDQLKKEAAKLKKKLSATEAALAQRDEQAMELEAKLKGTLPPNRGSTALHRSTAVHTHDGAAAAGGAARLRQLQRVGVASVETQRIHPRRRILQLSGSNLAKCTSACSGTFASSNDSRIVVSASRMGLCTGLLDVIEGELAGRCGGAALFLCICK